MIFLDTNVISEDFRKEPHPGVLAWLRRFDAELALSTFAVAEIAYGISKLHPDQRAKRLETGLLEWRRRFAQRIYSLTEDAALAYGEMMGRLSRQGRAMEMGDGLIAAIAKVNGGRLATRNVGHFAHAGIELINPWEF